MKGRRRLSKKAVADSSGNAQGGGGADDDDDSAGSWGLGKRDNTLRGKAIYKEVLFALPILIWQVLFALRATGLIWQVPSYIEGAPIWQVPEMLPLQEKEHKELRLQLPKKMDEYAEVREDDEAAEDRWRVRSIIG